MVEKEGLFPVSREALVARLLAHGIQPTVQRLDIAGVLLSASQHLSADQILERLACTGAAGSKATVYNTLALLAERGLVRELTVDSTRVFYDSNLAPHHHFYNVDDGTIVDVDAEELPLVRLPAPPPGAEILGVDVVIRVRTRR
ncbi:MAG: transcriptional repressor [Gammaproteobacteria bacterium]|nr:transcriptional repressor [Gammaproteobacteria bacterium]